MPPKFEHKLRRHKRRFEKIATTVVLDKMKICYDQGCKDIGVVLAMEWCHYLFYLQLWELFFQNHSWKLFPPIATSVFVKFKRNPALTLLPYNMKIILRLKGLLKQHLISGISIF